MANYCYYYYYFWGDVLQMILTFLMYLFIFWLFTQGGRNEERE